MPKTTYTRKLEKMLEDKQTVEGEQPLAFLVSVYQNNRNKLELRVEAAKAACVYVHRKMPVAVEIDQTVHLEYQPAPTNNVPLPATIAKRLTGSN